MLQNVLIDSMATPEYYPYTVRNSLVQMARSAFPYGFLQICKVIKANTGPVGPLRGINNLACSVNFACSVKCPKHLLWLVVYVVWSGPLWLFRILWPTEQLGQLCLLGWSPATSVFTSIPHHTTPPPTTHQYTHSPPYTWYS